jgi:uncharacterized protein involved in outer membrane biogenesis
MRGSRRKSWFGLGGLVRIVSGLIGVAIAAGAAVLLIATAGFLAPWRAEAIEWLLEARLGAPVEIEGPVDFQFGSTLLVTGSKIRVERPEGSQAGQSDTIEEGGFGLRMKSLLRGQFDLSRLTLKGVALAENSSLVGFDPDAPVDEPA